MKTKDIAERYGIDQYEFEGFLSDTEKEYTVGLLNISVEDGMVAKYVAEFQDMVRGNQEDAEYKKEAERLEKERKRQEEAKRLEEERIAQREKQIAMSKILISSGFNFEGYKIVKYSGYISGDDATQIPRSGVFGKNNGADLTKALVKIRRQALLELKEAAYNLGCNAVIGVDFDYITLEPETATITGGTLYEPYVICVTANGNAVIIEKEDDNTQI